MKRKNKDQERQQELYDATHSDANKIRQRTTSSPYTSYMAKKASGVRASSPEATAKRPETWQEDKKSGDKKSTASQKDGLLVQLGEHDPAPVSEDELCVAGKRTKKSVERLDMQVPQHKELTIAQGSGDKLGDIPRINFQIGKLKSEELKPLHAILFERPGKMASVKKNLRLFNGFPFSAGSEEYLKKRDKLLKNAHLTNAKLKLVCSILDLGKKGTQSELVDRIMTFLVEPKDSGKRLPVKKKQRSRKKTSADSGAKSKQTKSDGKRKRVSSSSSSSPKKSKAPSKSKAIVMDSSSDEEEEEDKVPDGKASDTEDKSSRTDDDDEERDEEEDQKPSRTPAKKTPPPRKRVKRDISDNDSDINEAKKKKPAPKTKKADSSSSSKNTNTADDTSDEDEPLIKMIKRAPSDDELKETVCTLLKDADLAQWTMKHICQRVFDTYPDHDLSGRKDFIKQSVKSLIT
ncbi:protein DEK-like [Hippocampus zosterae]|uniref:protein DEK-like n=1 Tax=Hippocampus zosterae TaxID=109293 RepID=UPI00223D99C8|nr:protein DEK-like [Hippocampus zosterae]